MINLEKASPETIGKIAKLLDIPEDKLTLLFEILNDLNKES